VASMPVVVASGTGGAQKDRLLALEERVGELEQRLAQLEAML